MLQANEEEWFPVVDEDGKTVFKAPRSVCHDGKSMLLHPVVHMHLFNRHGELYLQKRSMSKDLLPGKWDTSVGGHIGLEEGVEEALKRETREELGLADFDFNFIEKYIWNSPMERELVYSFRGHSNDKPVINPDEIDEGRFWTVVEIRNNIGAGIFTPNFENEFKKMF
jgi:isopentenyldiphosphate isomerase